MKRRTLMAFGFVLGALAMVLVWQASNSDHHSLTPLSTAIVEALEQAPRGFTDVSESVCRFGTELALQKSGEELGVETRLIELGLNNEPDTGLSGSFSKSNWLYFGEVGLWLIVNDKEQFCRATIQTRSW